MKRSLLDFQVRTYIRYENGRIIIMWLNGESWLDDLKRLTYTDLSDGSIRIIICSTTDGVVCDWRENSSAGAYMRSMS